MVDGRQDSPVSAILASVERSQSARFLQVGRASKKEELQKSELYSSVFGKWLILFRAESGGEKCKKSFSPEVLSCDVQVARSSHSSAGPAKEEPSSAFCSPCYTAYGIVLSPSFAHLLTNLLTPWKI